MARRDDEAAAAILQTDPLKRLDAIIRRHGGKPKAEPPPQSDDLAARREARVQGAAHVRRSDR